MTHFHHRNALIANSDQEMSKFLLFAAALLSCALLAQSSVIFYKSFDNDYLANTVNATVKLTVFNLGTEDIVDVEVQDRWPTEHFSIFGNLSAKFETISGGSNASHTFVVLPNFEGYYMPDRAMVTYKEAADADAVIGYSNPMYNVSVLPYALYQKFNANHAFEWTVYFVALALVVGLPLLSYTQQQSSTDHFVTKSKLNKKRD